MKVYCKNCKFFPTRHFHAFNYSSCNAITHTWTRFYEATPYEQESKQQINEYAIPAVHNKYNTCKYYKESLFYKLFKRWMK